MNCYTATLTAMAVILTGLSACVCVGVESRWQATIYDNFVELSFLSAHLGVVLT